MCLFCVSFFFPKGVKINGQVDLIFKFSQRLECTALRKTADGMLLEMTAHEAHILGARPLLRLAPTLHGGQKFS